ncbi:diaminopimelate epimerase [Patiriisocius marinistellae]|uniref:diaminopimelate epimerase n=1 Tax=Patiriisocius marinistellae TaxID=2494560 RepID=UPI00125D3464|nr:diaminopimelate epimerase [Patiriisocius marinistellae]
MELTFYKYQGTGNDFVIIDNRQNVFFKNDTKLVARLCDRKYGIGADGLILLENHNALDFNMVYYNADGNESSMCGNGGRCIVHFAAFLGLINGKTKFEAIDGLHTAEILNGEVSLQMANVTEISNNQNFSFLNTGSPHHVQMVTDIDNFGVFSEGKKIRNSIYGNEGSNVNFVEQERNDVFKVRTYERGVEDETLSCGTGVTAVALAMFATGKTTAKEVTLKTPGGLLKVSFNPTENGYNNVMLTGPATQVFKGTITI